MILEDNRGLLDGVLQSYIRDFTCSRCIRTRSPYLMPAHGFHHVAIECRSPVPDVDRLPVPAPPKRINRRSALADALNENAAPEQPAVHSGLRGVGRR
jgi:hypothetical protein